MKQKSILLGLVMGLTLASQDTQSLGMGTIQVHSALDQPLQASIDLMMGENEDFSNLSVKLASEADYKKVGLDRSFVPSNISVAIDEDNPLLIRVSSAGPISEPIVTLLLDVNWGNGRIFREFTVLLDPPVYSSSQIINESAVTEVATYQAPETVETVEEAVDETPQVQTRAEAEVADTTVIEDEQVVDKVEPVVEESTDSYESTVGSVEVMSGDTLWALANQNKPSALTTNQMMAALFNNNPQAFTNNNINQLIKGSRLMIPTANELQTISQADALDLVQSHNNSWAPSQASEDSYSSFQTSEPVYEAPAEEVVEAIDYGVELSGSTDQEDSNGGQEGENYENLNENAVAEELYNKDSENEDLKERLSELEGIVVQQQEALEIKSDDLANLEDQLTETPEDTVAAVDAALEESDDVWGDDTSVALTEEELAAEGDSESMIADIEVSEEPTVDDVEQEVGVEDKPEPVQSTTPSFSGSQNNEESMVDKGVNWVMGNLQWLLIGLAALLALIFVPKFFRSRNKDVAEETSFLDDIKARKNDDESSENVLMPGEDTKINEPLKEDEIEEVPVDGDVLADLDKKIDFESESQDEDDDEDIFQGFDDEPEVEDAAQSSESEDDGFDLDGFLSEDDADDSTEVDKAEVLEIEGVSDTEEESFDVDEDFDFDLSELDDLEDGVKATDDNDLSEEIDDALESLNEGVEEAVEEVAEAVEDSEPDFSLDEDFEFDLDGELDGLSDEADEAVEEMADAADDAFDEVMDISEDEADTLEVSTEADDSEIDLGLDLDDMLEDGDVIDTKIDLAKAYLEMGDKDGAKNLLKEVAAEGSDSQIDTAKKLLDDM